MTPARELALVVERELLRSLRSAKGILLLLITLLGGTVSTLVAIRAQEFVQTKLGRAESLEARKQALEVAYGAVAASSLAEAPTALLGLALSTLSLSALLAAFLGYDTLAGELSHRQIRYFTLRAQRSSLVFGKLLGTFAVASLMTLAIHTIAWVLVPLKTSTPVADVLAWGPRLWLATLPVSFAWCGLVTFVSSLPRTPILALLLAFFGMILVWSGYAAAVAYEVDALTWINPGHYDQLLFSPELHKLAGGVAAGLGWGAGFGALAVLTLIRRDL